VHNVGKFIGLTRSIITGAKKVAEIAHKGCQLICITIITLSLSDSPLTLSDVFVSGTQRDSPHGVIASFRNTFCVFISGKGTHTNLHRNRRWRRLQNACGSLNTFRACSTTQTHSVQPQVRLRKEGGCRFFGDLLPKNANVHLKISKNVRAFQSTSLLHTKRVVCDTSTSNLVPLVTLFRSAARLVTQT